MVRGFVSAIFAAVVCFPALAASDLESGLDELATQIIQRTANDETVTIAVTPFRHSNDQCSEMSNFIADELIFSLLQVGDGKVSIVERAQLQSIFEELKFNLSGAVDTQTARRCGRIDSPWLKGIPARAS